MCSVQYLPSTGLYLTQHFLECIWSLSAQTQHQKKMFSVEITRIFDIFWKFADVCHPWFIYSFLSAEVSNNMGVFWDKVSACWPVWRVKLLFLDYWYYYLFIAMYTVVQKFGVDKIFYVFERRLLCSRMMHLLYLINDTVKTVILWNIIQI